MTWQDDLHTMAIRIRTARIAEGLPPEPTSQCTISAVNWRPGDVLAVEATDGRRWSGQIQDVNPRPDGG